MSIVTRFAPSPTGFLHVGGARTAIFNWLYARNMGGRFILRVEDTDRERSTQEATDAILDGMAWLGLDYDEIFYQSQRADLHNAKIDELLASGQAYWCACTKEEVDAMRERARAEGRKPKYEGACRDKNLGPGEGRVVRLKAPVEGQTSYKDMVKGTMRFDNAELDDLVLRRSDGSPTYNLAVAVDDADMGVTHILRGDDHVSNTPKQVLIYQALGLTPPTFGHVPMILGPDKKKLSKRHGATSVTMYREMGYLPEAMRNYLLRLGWSHGDKEVFSLDEMIELFTPDNLGTSPAVFDTQKLDWLNQEYLKLAEISRLVDLVTPFLAEMGLTPDRETLTKLVPELTARAKTVREMAESARVFCISATEVEYADKAVKKFLTDDARGYLAEIRTVLAELPDFELGTVEAGVKAWMEERELSFKQVAQPIRVAVTGNTVSPGIFETLWVLGREECIARLDLAVQKG